MRTHSLVVGGAFLTLSSCGGGERQPPLPVPSACGTLDASACSDDTVACTNLGASFTAGEAKCRADCSGWDVSSCTRTTNTAHEIVQPRFREPERFPDAVCSRSGDFPFYVKVTGSKRWVIRLQGGGACESSNCYRRPARYTSPTANGALNDRAFATKKDDPRDIPTAFTDANYVELHYCSNDAWAGRRVTPLAIPDGRGGTFPFSFAGRANVKATLDMLRLRYGLDDADDETRVYFTGGSAGGHGVTANVDQVAAALPRAVAAKRVHAWAKSAVYPFGWKDVDANVPGDWSLRDDAGDATGVYWEDPQGLAADFASKDASGNPLCMVAHPGTEWQCAYASVAQRFIADAPPLGLGVPIGYSFNVEDPVPQRRFGIDEAAPGAVAASTAWGDLTAMQARTMKWVYAPRDPFGYHGFTFDVEPLDATPAFKAVIDAFVDAPEPANFSYVDFPVVHGDASEVE